MNEKQLKMYEIGVLPVINFTDETCVCPLLDVFTKIGIPSMEITLRSDVSLNAIRLVKDKYPDMYLGVGTVITIEDAKNAIEAGADYIVSPGFDLEIIEYCRNKNVDVIPGCSTPSEMQIAKKNGLEIVKFFPSELSGGIKALNLYSLAFAGLKFIPTGGINLDNLGNYLERAEVLVCGGSYMAASKLLNNRDFVTIERDCTKALEIARIARSKLKLG